MPVCRLYLVIDIATRTVQRAEISLYGCIVQKPGLAYCVLHSEDRERPGEARERMIHTLAMMTSMAWVEPLLSEEVRSEVVAHRDQQHYPPGDPRHVPVVGNFVIKFTYDNTGLTFYDICLEEERVSTTPEGATRRNLQVSNIRAGLLRERLGQLLRIEVVEI